MDDNISRKAIIDRLNRVIEHGVASKTTGLHPISAETVKECVEALPPAEQRTGKWLDPDFCGQLVCSECGNYSIDEYDYCPHCGAKMEGDK